MTLTPTEGKRQADRAASAEAERKEAEYQERRDAAKEQAKKDLPNKWKEVKAEIDKAADMRQTKCSWYESDSRDHQIGYAYLEVLKKGIERRCKRIGVTVEGRIEHREETIYCGQCNPEPVGYEFVCYAMYLTLTWEG